MIAAICLFLILTVAVYTDITTRMIPNGLTLTGLGIGLFIRLAMPELPMWEYMLGGLMGFVLIFGIAVLSRGGIGGGDVKLFAVIGVFLGWEGFLLSLAFSSFIGVLYGMAFIITGKANQYTPIPFAPSILTGTIFAYLFGEYWVNVYLDFMWL